MKHKILSLLVFCGFAICALAQSVQAETLVISDKNQVAGQSSAGERTQQALIVRDQPYKPDKYRPDKYRIVSPSDLPKGKGYPDEDNRKTDGACLNSFVNPAALWINPGDVLGDKLQSWAKTYGYELVWEGDDLKSMGRLQSEKGLTDTLVDIKQAMEQNGIHLEITTYTNCVVRVVEVQDE